MTTGNKMKMISSSSAILLTNHCIILAMIQLAYLSSIEAYSINMRMPDIKPDYADQYLCLAHRLNNADNQGELIVGFNPIGNSRRVHHMLIYGCKLPGIYQPDSPAFVWDCSGMRNSADMNRTFEFGPVCESKDQILYGWALDAKPFKLPDKVGFKVGGPESDIQYLVLQVHYHSINNNNNHNQKHPQNHEHIHDNGIMNANANSNSNDPMRLGLLYHDGDDNFAPDNSGVILDMKRDDDNSGITRQAGVLLLSSGGYVKMGKSRHEIWCDLDEDVRIHPFRFRVHTHKLGTRVIGAKLSRGRIAYEMGRRFKYGDQSEAIIGERNPQDPEMFYPVDDQNLVLKRGDTVYAACEYDNNMGHVVLIGPTSDDEMCNFYLMYWTDSPKTLSQSDCFGVNPRELLQF